MNSKHRTSAYPHRASLLCLAALALAPGIGRAESPRAPEPTSDAIAKKLPLRPRAMVLPRVQLPSAPEGDDTSLGGTGVNPFGKAAAPSATTAGQTLTAPVTVNANASSNAMTITQTGTGSALSGTVNNSSSATSAVKGLGNGSGAGIYGSNSGKSGQAGKFEITNASSFQPAVLATTTGPGSGLQAIVKKETGNDVPAVLGQNTTNALYGIGVQGEGSYVGVMGKSGSNGYGVYGTSPSGYGLYGSSSSGFGAVGESTNGIGVFGQSTSSIGSYGLSNSSYGVYGYSSSNAGVYGESNGNYGVYAYSQNSYGLVAQSGATFAGVFYGPVYVSGTVTANSYGYTSDREQKQDAIAVDSADVLTRIADMPITAWRYKSKPAERHIGPMAQDFHAAFGLGADDKHIDVVDGIGVSLAAIKALQQQVEEKSARIDMLEAKLQALQQAVDARLAALEAPAGRSIAMASATGRP